MNKHHLPGELDIYFLKPLRKRGENNYKKGMILAGLETLNEKSQKTKIGNH